METLSISCCCLAMKLLGEFYQSNSLSTKTLKEIEALAPQDYAELCELLRVAPPETDALELSRQEHILYQLEFVFDVNHNLLVEDQYCRALKC